METRKKDGSVELTDQATDKDIEDALVGDQTAFVALHLPGSTVTTARGVHFRVDAVGCWEKMSPPTEKTVEHRVMRAMKEATNTRIGPQARVANILGILEGRI